MPATPGTVLEYRYERGGGFRDSVGAAVAGTWVVWRTVFSYTGVTERVEQRTFVLRAEGLVQVDQNGSQLLYPLPGPPQRQWSYRYRDRLYTYTPLGYEVVYVPAGAFSAHRVQLTIEDGGALGAYDLWLVGGIGAVKRRSRPNAGPSDYELIASRAPQVIAAVPSPRPYLVGPGPKPRSARSRASRDATGLQWGLGALYIARVPDPSGAPRFVGPYIEGGVGDVVGLRVRYGYGFPLVESDSGLSASSAQLLAVELFAGLSGRRGALQAGIGIGQVFFRNADGVKSDSSQITVFLDGEITLLGRARLSVGAAYILNQYITSASANNGLALTCGLRFR